MIFVIKIIKYTCFTEKFGHFLEIERTGGQRDFLALVLERIQEELNNAVGRILSANLKKEIKMDIKAYMTMQGFVDLGVKIF